MSQLRGKLNVIFMGICFSLLFTSYFTIANLEKIFLVSVKDEVPGYTGDGYFSQAVISIVTAICLWISPAVCNAVGSKLTMFLGALCFTGFICSFFIPVTWVLYAASGLVGLGAALLWIGQSAYLILNSDQTTLETNLGLFFTLYQSGALLGNVFVYFQFYGKTYVDADTRHWVTLCMSVIVALGGLLILLLPHYEKEPQESGSKESCESGANAAVKQQQAEDVALIQTIESPIQTFRKGWKIAATPEVLILLFMFANIGFSHIFTIVYNTCLGFTRTIPRSLEMVPVAGLVSGLGGMLGGIMPVLIRPEMNLPLNIRPLMGIAFISYVCAYVIAFLNFPAVSIFGFTYEKALIESTSSLAIIGSFLLHMAETLYNNETAVLLAKIFPHDTVSAFAVFLFFKNCFAALTMAGSNYGDLHVQIQALSLLLLLGTWSFWFVSKRLHRRRVETYIAAVSLK